MNGYILHLQNHSLDKTTCQDQDQVLQDQRYQNQSQTSKDWDIQKLVLNSLQTKTGAWGWHLYGQVITKSDGLLQSAEDCLLWTRSFTWLSTKITRCLAMSHFYWMCSSRTALLSLFSFTFALVYKMCILWLTLISIIAPICRLNVKSVKALFLSYCMTECNATIVFIMIFRSFIEILF